VVDRRFKAVDKRFDAVDQRFDAVDQRFEQIDACFDRLSARMDAGFMSMNDKLSAILRILDQKSDHHFKILNEHEERLSDLETWRRSTGSIRG
jgi:hypothetical protein